MEEAQEALELQRMDLPIPGDDDESRAAVLDAQTFISAMKTRIHECEGALRVALGSLDDAERLLERAVHRRRREDNILTLFAALGAANGGGAWDARSREDPPYTETPTLDLACGMLILCSDVMSRRLRVFLKLFDWDGDGFLRERELVAALKCASRLLGGLGFLRRPASDLELDSLAARALAEQRVKSDAEGMTIAEATDWVADVVSNSTFLSKLFGVRFAFGELSAYQRQKMPTVRLFELGLLRPADVKYRPPASEIRRASRRGRRDADSPRRWRRGDAAAA